MTWTKALFKPPRFEDEEKTRQAFLLHIILWTLLIIAILYFVYALLFYQEVTRRVLTQVFVGVVVTAFLLIMVRRGYVRSASIIQIAAFWVFFTATAWTAAGVQDQAYQIGYALVIVLAGFIIGLRGSLIMVGVSLLSGGLMVVASDMGSWSFKPPDKALDVWVISAIMFPILVVIQYLGKRLIRITLAQTRISEERYRTLIDEIDDGYHETDLAGNITFSNEAFLRNSGFSREELIGTNYSCYAVEEEDTKKVWNAYKQMYKTGIPVRALEVNMFMKDGTKRNIEIYASLLRDSDNRPTSFRGVIRDITERKNAEKALLDLTERLKNSLNATIQVIDSMIEIRDPYTSGHQRRVADLACAIATEMKLPNDQIEGIRIATIIHDIGKISIPNEILSKPSKLTNLELELIKMHTQAGYDILKDINFPWPIAKIILEHHERMDGSGYPNSLKGGQVLLESRILAVADVVESMISHRPFRPALGIGAALQEITNKKGVYYDPEVVDACLKLFKEKDYKIAE